MGRSISGRETCRKLEGLSWARTRASAVEMTSYGGLATSSAKAGGGRYARKDRTMAIAPRVSRVCGECRAGCKKWLVPSLGKKWLVPSLGKVVGTFPRKSGWHLWSVVDVARAHAR